MLTRRSGIGSSTARRHAAGFSLIEIAIALIIIGLLVSPIIESYSQRAVDDKILATTSNMTTITLALQSFYARYNSLPCPADPKLKQGDGNYGKNDCAATTVPNTALRAGAVPFRDLRIPASMGIDAWQTKIGYTMVFADAASPLNLNNNIIKINNYLPDHTYDTTGNKYVHYVLVSYGSDGLGGYSASGGSKGLCPANGYAEHINCSGGGTFWNSTNARSMTADVNYFDDLVSFNENLSPGIWTFIPPATSGITVPYESIWTQNYIGIGTSSPSTFLDVAGDIKIEANTTYKSKASANLVCNTAGGHCFDPAIIASTGMGAGPSNPSTSGCAKAAGSGTVATAMTAVRNGDAACAVQTGIVASCATCSGGTTCPAGKYLTGIDASGSMTCATP